MNRSTAFQQSRVRDAGSPGDDSGVTWGAMSRLSLTRLKIYRTVARQLHGLVPCWICREPVSLPDATLEHIKPLVDGGSSHIENLAISHRACNNGRHAKQARAVVSSPGEP
jgi:5-methylcytosine-specific restriction endonuclease McrA